MSRQSHTTTSQLLTRHTHRRVTSESHDHVTVVNKLVRLIALQYAARKCKQNKRYRTSARLDENT